MNTDENINLAAFLYLIKRKKFIKEFIFQLIKSRYAVNMNKYGIAFDWTHFLIYNKRQKKYAAK